MKIIHNNTPKNILNSEKLTGFFLAHLNRVYCAKAHLLERLPELAAEANFADLHDAIIETNKDVTKQLSRMEEIFSLIDSYISFDKCGDLIELIENAFHSVHLHKNDPELRNLSILFYMQNIERIAMTSFRILQLTAAKLHNTQVERLLLENFEEASEDNALLALITARHSVG